MKAVRLATILVLFAAIAFVSCANQPSPNTEEQPPIVPGKPAAEGKEAPDFTLPTLDGRSLSLSSFRGQIVVLKFWGIACRACVEELPLFQAVSDKWLGKAVVLAINERDSSEVVQKTLDNLGLTLPVLLDSEGKVCERYGRGYPTTFFIDYNGIVRLIDDRLFDNSDQIDSIIADLVSGY